MTTLGGRPADGGWGWMVIAGSFLTMAVLAMFSLSYSILFSEFLMSHGASSTTISWIFNLHFFLWNAVGVFTGPLTQELGIRPVSMVATTLASFCIFALVFADSVWYLLVFFALFGLFSGLGAKPCYFLLTLYFDRKRGRANAILMAGACFAQFVGPLLSRHLLAEYSFKGAILILSGIAFHCLVGTSLFQPPEWHLKKDEEGDCVRDEKKEMKEDEEDNVHEVDQDTGVADKMRVKEDQRRSLLKQSLSRRPSEISMLSLAVSTIDLSSIPPTSPRGSCVFEDTATTTTAASSKGVRGFLKASTRVMERVVSDLKILKSPLALIIVMGAVFTISPYMNFLMTVPFAIQHVGYSLSDAALCLSIAAVTNLVARLLSSALSDQKWFDIRLAYMAGATIIALSSAVFGFLRDLTQMKVAIGVWGCGVGICVSLGVLIIAHFMGADRMPSVFGVQSLAISLSMITFGPLFGFIRDASGSYTVSMMAMAITTALSVLLYFFMPAAVAYDKRKEAEQRKETREVLGTKV